MLKRLLLVWLFGSLALGCGSGSAEPSLEQRLASARTAEQAGDLPAAIEEYERVVAVLEQASPGFRPELEALSGDLASLYQNTGRHREAAAFRRRALALASERLSPTEPAFILAENNLASALNGAGRPAEAEQVLRGSLVRIDDPTSALHTARIANLGNSLQLQGRLAEAEPLLEAALNQLRARGDPSVADVSLMLASLMRKRGNEAGAQRHCAEALEHFRRELGASAPLTLNAESECRAAP
jgi:tetratricopeptide (TPR) repeat protein